MTYGFVILSLSIGPDMRPPTIVHVVLPLGLSPGTPLFTSRLPFFILLSLDLVLV